MIKRILFFAVALGLCAVGSANADDNVRAVQTKLRDGGFYSGEIDGAYSSELSVALSRYQTSNGLPITGQLDIDTSKALGATPAVRTDPAESAETWRRLRKGERQSASKSDGDTATSDEPDQKRSEKVSINRSSSSSGAEPETKVGSETKVRPETEAVQSPRPVTKRVARVSAEQLETQPVPETESIQTPRPISKRVARESSAGQPETQPVPETEMVQTPRPADKRVARVASAAQSETQLIPETEASPSPHRLFKRVARDSSAGQPETQPVPETRRIESSAPAATVEPRVGSDPGRSASLPNLSKARLRDYVAAFVLAGLDPASEIEFFADRVTYYDSGVEDRATIEKDLRSYKAQWPNRKFRVAGDIRIDRENDQRLRVTFPLSFDLSNGQKRSAGKVEKSLILEPAGGDDLRIVAVTERLI